MHGYKPYFIITVNFMYVFEEDQCCNYTAYCSDCDQGNGGGVVKIVYNVCVCTHTGC